MPDPVELSVVTQDPDVRLAAGSAGGPRDELRLALSMRGGVSLAVWIGGAAAEIERLSRCALPNAAASGQEQYYRDLLRLAGYHRAVIDVITGASAGGLNGVFLAASRAYGFDFDTMARMWVELSDIEALTRDPTKRSKPLGGGRTTRRVSSLLDGDGYFLVQVHDALRRLIRDGNKDHATRDPFSVVLAATLVEPRADHRVEDPFSEVIETRQAASFQFRFVGEVGDNNSGDFQSVELATGGTPGATAELLALAGRATSSFPVAFEAAQVGASSSAVFSDPPSSGEVQRVMDGGVLDNIPVSKAIEAIAAAPTTRGTDRWLMFLHPSPSEKVLRAAISPEKPMAPQVIQSLMRTVAAKFGQESLRDDLEELRRYNEATQRLNARRRAALRSAESGAGGQLPVAGPRLVIGNVVSLVPEHHRTQAQMDAQRVVAILDGSMRVRRPVSDGQDRALQSDWVRKHRATMEADVTAAYEALYAEPDLLASIGAVTSAPWFGSAAAHAALLSPGGLVQAVELVRGWMRELPDETSTMRALHAQLLSLRDLAFMSLDWSDQVWLEASRSGPTVGDAWAERAARGATLQVRAIPSNLAAKFVAAYDGLASPSASSGPGASYASRPTGSCREALLDVDRHVRARISARTDHADDCRDLAELVWQRLGTIVATACSASHQPPPYPTPASRSGGLSAGAAEFATDGWTGPDDEVRARLNRLFVSLESAGPDDSLPALGGYEALLAALVMLFAPFESSTRPGRDVIRFVRVSGNNRSPLEPFFLEPGEHKLSADDKLCGNDFGNFSAFLSARWRLNDWMWGRLDAVKSVVDLLVRAERIERNELTPDEMLQLVTGILAAERIALSSVDRDAIANELAAAHESAKAGPPLERTRALLTEALQRHVLRQMIGTVSQCKHEPDYPDGTELVPAEHLDEKLRGYRVGRESLRDLKRRRRTQIVMRLAMVLWHALAPGGKRKRDRAILVLRAFFKPIYLYAAFGFADRARALFLINLMLTGWLVGPWVSGADGSEPWITTRLVGRSDGWVGRWHELPGGAQSLLGITTASGLFALWLAFVNLRSQKAARRSERRPISGLFWHLGSTAASVAAPIALIGFGKGTGWGTVCVGAAAIAAFATWWMRRRWMSALTVATGLTYLGTLQLFGKTSGNLLTWSFVALYASMTLISLACTTSAVLPAPRLQQQIETAPLSSAPPRKGGSS